MIGYNDSAALVTALGSAQADATPLRAKFNNVNSAAASTGVSLPAGAVAGEMVCVTVNAANAVLVYPATAAGTIAGGSAGAGYSQALTNEKTKQAIYVCWGSDVWTRVISG